MYLKRRFIFYNSFYLRLTENLLEQNIFSKGVLRVLFRTFFSKMYNKKNIYHRTIPLGKHLHKTTLLLPYCKSSSGHNSFNQHSTMQITYYTQETNTCRVVTFTFVTIPFVQGSIQAPRQSIGATPKLKLKFNSLTSHSNTAIPPFFKHSPEIHPALEPYQI